MKKKLIILGLALSLPFYGFAQTTFKRDVLLTYYSGKSILKGKECKPNKSPVKVSVKVSIDQDGRLSIMSLSDTTIEYSICDGNDVVLLAGCYESSSSVWNTVDISSLLSGVYTLYIVANEKIFRGDIEIDV